MSKPQGELAETAFLHRATELELPVSKPYGDNQRYDFIVDGGRKRWRVQVKSTRQFDPKRKNYQARVGRRVGQGSQRVCYLESELDFFAVYIVPEDTWYIIPFAALNGRMSLSLHSSQHAKPGPMEAYREAWHLLRE